MIQRNACRIDCFKKKWINIITNEEMENLVDMRALGMIFKIYLVKERNGL